MAFAAATTAEVRLALVGEEAVVAKSRRVVSKVEVMEGGGRGPSPPAPPPVLLEDAAAAAAAAPAPSVASTAAALVKVVEEQEMPAVVTPLPTMLGRVMPRVRTFCCPPLPPPPLGVEGMVEKRVEWRFWGITSKVEEVLPDPRRARGDLKVAEEGVVEVELEAEEVVGFPLVERL